MLIDEDTLFRSDGTLRFLRYLKASGHRPAVVEVTFRVQGKPKLTTSFTVVGRDFRPVYVTAVVALAQHIGVGEGDKTLARMLETCDAFLRRYNLRLVPVVYEQVTELG